MDRLRQPSLDILRGFAAFWVFLYHVKEGRHIDLTLSKLDSSIVNTIFSTGNSAVAIFFVLSGFVIAQVGKEAGTKSGALAFLIRRGWRIGPAYYVSIGVAMGYIALKNLFTDHTTAWPTVKDVAVHLIFLQDLAQVAALNAVYWTLCIEVQFYIAFVCFMAMIKQISRWMHTELAHAITFGGSLIIALLGPLGLVEHGLISASFLPTLHLFLLGILLNFALNGMRWAAVEFVIYAVMLLLIAVGTHNAFTLVGIVTSMALFANSQWKPVLNAKKFQLFSFFGLISYSFYLFHNNVTGASFNLAKRMLGDGVTAEMAGLLLSFSLCFVLAATCYYTIERPGIRIGKRMVQRFQRTAVQQPKHSRGGNAVFPE